MWDGRTDRRQTLAQYTGPERRHPYVTQGDGRSPQEGSALKDMTMIRQVVPPPRPSRSWATFDPLDHYWE